MTDRDDVLADRCVALLRYHGGGMDNHALSAILREDTDQIVRVLSLRADVQAVKRAGLTVFSVRKGKA